MISQTVEYALRAMVFLADKKEPRTTQQIAEVTQVPAAYLSKVMQGLNRARLVHSQRGLHGGFALARSPEELTIWDVVQAVEPLQRIRSCPLDLDAHRVRLCPLHKRLDDALAMIEKAFKETTLAEILAEPTTSKPLCPFPHGQVSV
jgi:Rrf2 family transcriptional regulator, nitric oxide-sensitive transcriptional repressor